MDASELAITARMARLTLSREELEKLGVAVEQMLRHFSHMKEIDVQGLAPTTHALLRENRLREDVESRLDAARHASGQRSRTRGALHRHPERALSSAAPRREAEGQWTGTAWRHMQETAKKWKAFVESRQEELGSFLQFDPALGSAIPPPTGRSRAFPLP